jgi:CubicO group peptidase (beta-lactamase class C family)
VYINGVLAAERLEWVHAYRYIGISAAARAAISSRGTNVIAVEVEDTGGDRYFDLGLAITTKLNDRPMSGFSTTPTLAMFDSIIKSQMIDESVPAATVSIMKDDTLAYSKGFGWMDKNFTVQAQRDAVMRLASVDKMVSIMTIAKLVRDGYIDSTTGEPVTYDTPVFPLLSRHEPRIANTPAGHPDIDLVTVGHLVNHVGGLVEGPDLATFFDIVGKGPGTTDATDNMVWVKQAGMAHTPGTCPPDTECYSNVGFDTLRYFIHTLTSDLLDTMRNDVFAPAGTGDVFIAHEPIALRSPREPWYVTLEHPWERSVFLENVHGLASTSEALVRMQSIYHNGNGSLLFNPVTGAYEPSDNGGGGTNGGFSGTATKAVQLRWNRVSYAILFNSGTSDPQKLGEKIECLALSVADSEWGVGPLSLLAWKGFEDAGFWFSPSGHALGQTNSTISQGTHALSIPGGFVQIRSAQFDGCEFRAPTSTLALDVYVPTTQPNPHWLGQVTAHLTCPDANIHNKYLGEKPLTGLTPGRVPHGDLQHGPTSPSAIRDPHPMPLRLCPEHQCGSGTWHIDNLRLQ